MSLRYRQRKKLNNVDIFVQLKVYDADGNQTGTQSITLPDKPVSFTSEEIWDVPFGGKAYNVVTHSKVSYSGTTTLNRDFFAFKRTYPFEGSVLGRASGFVCPPAPEPPSPDPTWLNDFAWDAFENATSQFETQVEIANALYELKDLAGMLEEKWEGILKGVSKEHLSFIFGWKPMLKDIQSTVSTARYVRKRLLHLKKTWGKPVTSQFSKRFVNDHSDPSLVPWDEPSDSPFISWANWASIGLQLSTMPEKVEGVVTATLVTYHELEGLDSAMAFCKGLENSLGLNNLISTGWQAMPFSWMVEWFINVQHAIHAIEVEPFKGTIKLLDAGYSVKSSATHGVYAGYPKVSAPPTMSPIMGRFQITRVGQVESKKYIRRKGLPLGAMVFFEHEFNLSQLAILGAILISGHES